MDNIGLLYHRGLRGNVLFKWSRFWDTS